WNLTGVRPDVRRQVRVVVIDTRVDVGDDDAAVARREVGPRREGLDFLKSPERSVRPEGIVRRTGHRAANAVRLDEDDVRIGAEGGHGGLDALPLWQLHVMHVDRGETANHSRAARRERVVPTEIGCGRMEFDEEFARNVVRTLLLAAWAG